MWFSQITLSNSLFVYLSLSLSLYLSLCLFTCQSVNQLPKFLNIPFICFPSFVLFSKNLISFLLFLSFFEYPLFPLPSPPSFTPSPPGHFVCSTASIVPSNNSLFSIGLRKGRRYGRTQNNNCTADLKGFRCLPGFRRGEKAVKGEKRDEDKREIGVLWRREIKVDKVIFGI